MNRLARSGLALLISLIPPVLGCSRGATKCLPSSPTQTTDASASDAPAPDAPDTATSDADASADTLDDATSDADASADTLADAADAGTQALLSPIRFHLRNDGPGDVYLGLRFIDRCAFDYTVDELDSSDGGSDAGASSVITDQPSCLCHRPNCSDCATCSPVSCDELCDELPPRIAPGQERVLTWDGRVYAFVKMCGIRCAEQSSAAPGRYRLTVPSYDNADQAANRVAPARQANLAFELGGSSTEGTDVELSIRLP